MRKLLTSVMTVAVVAAAGCSTAPEKQVVLEDTAKGKNGLQRSLSVTSVSRKLSPSSAELAQYRGGSLGELSAVSINLRDLAQNPVGYSGDGEALVAGGAQITSQFTEEQVAAAQALAKAQGPQDGINVLPNGADNLEVNNNGNGKGVGKKGPKLRSVIDSIGAEDCCVDSPFTATVPPDPELAVGPDHLVAAINVTIEIYDKQGNVELPAIAFGSLFPPGFVPFDACSGGFPFDPDVVFDEAEGRYIIGYDGGGAFYCMAVSQTDDAMGDYWLYWFDASNGLSEFFDFPHMGVGHDALYVGSNQFSGQGCPGFCYGVVHAVNKADLYSGNAPAVIRQVVPNFDGTPQPANPSGAIEGTLPDSGPHYIMTEVFDGKHHSVYAWDDPFGANNFYLVGDVDLATASGVPCEGGSCFPIPVPQNDGGNLLLAGNDWRGQETKQRNGSLWTTQHISCNPGSNVVNCVRWAEIDPTQVSPGLDSTDGVIQAGVFAADDGNSRWFPSLNVNRCGDMAIGYSKSGPDMLPSVAITGRRNNDTPGFVRSEVDVFAGTEIYRSFQSGVTRWGDYTSMAIDPNGKDFWYIGQSTGPNDNPFINYQNVIAKANFGCRVNGKSKKK